MSPLPPPVWRAAAGAALALLLAHGPAPVAAEEARIATATAESRRIVERVELNGTVIAPRSARISSEIGGIVARVLVDLGDVAGAGEPLIELDRGLAVLALRRAEAVAREARETLDDARRRLDDATELLRRNSLPRNELESRASEMRIAEASVERVEAEVALERARIDRRTIRAPFDGVVAARLTEAGEWVEPGDTVIELVATNRLVVDVPVPQQRFTALGAAPDIALAFDAMPGERFGGRPLTRVPVTDPAARTFTLRIEPDVPPGSLTPGMSARVTLGFDTGRTDMTVPRDAVIRYPDGRTIVWTVAGRGDEATVAERQVELGLAFDGYVQVIDGIEAGERVVTRGNEALEPGQAVRLTGDEG